MRPLMAVNIALAANDGGVIFGGNDLLGTAQVFHGGGFQLAAHFFGDDGAAGQDSDILQHGFAAVTKARSLDGQNVEHTAQFVQNQGGQCFAVDIFGNDDQFALADLDQFLEERNDVVSSGDLLVVDQDISICNIGFHVFGVGDEVGRNVAAVKLHTFNVFGFKFEAFGFFNGDDAIFANFVHHIGNQVTNGAVLGRDGGNVRNIFFGGQFNGLFADGIADGFGGGLNTRLSSMGLAPAARV